MKQKFLVAGFVVALLVGGISLDALASSNEGSSGSKQGVLVAAKKKVKKARKAKKAKKPKMEKSAETGAPAETSAPETAVPATGPTSDHAADVTLKCGAKEIVLQFVDRPAPEVQVDQFNPDYGKVKDGIWQLNDKRKDCVSSILTAWHDDVVFGPGKTYPDKIMQQRLGVAPVEYKDSFYSDGRKMWKYYFSGDSILKALGDKFAPADADSGMKGSPCYKYTITDGRAMPKISADSSMVGIWTSSWRENGTVTEDPTCSKPDKNM